MFRRRAITVHVSLSGVEHDERHDPAGVGRHEFIVHRSLSGCPRPHCYPMWDHFKTKPSVQQDPCRELLANPQGSRGLVHVTDARYLSYRWEEIAPVDVTTCELCGFELLGNS